MMESHSKPSRLVGLEDLQPGTYVTIAHETYELIPWDCEGPWKHELEPVRITCMPWNSGWPYRVVGICAPYVFVADPHGEHRSLDMRRCRLARLSRRFGKNAFKAVARQSARRKK